MRKRTAATRGFVPREKRAMPRRRALDIAGRAFARSGRVHPEIRDEILGTQIAKPTPPQIHPTFAGWTADELTAFYLHGKIPERYKA